MERTRFSLRQVVVAAAAVLAVMLLADLNNRWNEKQRLTLQHEQAAADKAALEATALALQEGLIYASSDAAVESWAYEAGGMVRPGDNVYVPQPAPGGPPTPTPTPHSAAEEPSNWDIWWSLFFDDGESDR